MWALLGCIAVIGVCASIAVFLGRREQIQEHELPWNLAETGGRQITILSGLAGFAITAIVLLVTLTRTTTAAQLESLNTVVLMFVTAYLFYIGTAVLFAYLPREDPLEGGPPRMSFALATNMFYRTLFLAWFALHPLMDAAGLPVPAHLLIWVISASGGLASVFTTAIFCRVGVLRIREILLFPGSAFIGFLIYVVIASVAAIPKQTAEAPQYLTLAFFALNALTFLHFSFRLLAGVSENVANGLRRYQRLAFVADVQATLVLLLFLWTSVIGLI